MIVVRDIFHAKFGQSKEITTLLLCLNPHRFARIMRL
jgi:hypothetical protein